MFNAGRFLAQKLEVCTLDHQINQVYVYFALAKVAMLLEAYKTARQCYEKFNALLVPSALQEEIELNSLLIKSKPFQDSEHIAHLCSRCLNVNQV